MSRIQRGVRYALGRLCSFLPKQGRKAVFESFNGRGYSDSPKAIAQELLARGGGYAELFAVQSQYYREGGQQDEA